MEVDYRAQTPEDQALFDAAKAKEIKAWIDHGLSNKWQKALSPPTK